MTMELQGIQTGPVIQHPYFGPAIPAKNWIPAPRYVLRRDRVLKHLQDIAPCRVLDIGCGPAVLLSELSARGFQAFGVDRSELAREIGAHFQRHSPGLELRAELDEQWKGTFDLLLSFEVIEHIEDDVGAMREWRQYLKPGGRMIVSTPAHPDRWNAADEWAGHVRRYDREQLIEAVEKAGFEVDLVECYGFPLANVMEKVCAPAYRKRLEQKLAARKEISARTDESGSDRSAHARFWPLYSNPVSSGAMRLFCQLQRPFLNADLGNGFIVIAKAL